MLIFKGVDVLRSRGLRRAAVKRNKQWCAGRAERVCLLCPSDSKRENDLRAKTPLLGRSAASMLELQGVFGRGSW